MRGFPCLLPLRAGRLGRLTAYITRTAEEVVVVCTPLVLCRVKSEASRSGVREK